MSVTAAAAASSAVSASASPSKKPAKAPAAKIRLPGRVADYFLIVGGIRQDAPEDRRFADKVTHTRRVSTALDKAAADAAAVLSAAAASSAAEGSLDGAAAIDAAAAAASASAAAPTPTPAPARSKPKSRTLWTPKVFDRYPRVDFPDNECPKEIELFCFPSSYEPGLMHAPESHTFILTEADGTRVYGSVLKVWEPLDEARLEVIERGVQQGWESVNAAEAATALSLSPSPSPNPGSPRATSPTAPRGSISSSVLLYVPKCLVIVSHWPYFSQFDRFLNCLYKGISAPSESNPNFVPLERVVLNFILETPLPPQGKFEVECRAFMNPSLGAWVNTNCPWGPHAGASGVAGAHAASSGAMTADKKFLFSRPPPNKLPLRDFPLGTLFRWLSLENILMLYSAVLTERRILFVSNHCHKLTIAAETITHLCCPFFWRHIYIPLLPARLSDFICAPMPYIVGILASYMPDSLMLDGTLVVNLDDNELTQSSGDPIAPLPPERYTALFRHLKKLVGSDPSQPYKGVLPLPDSEIESAFLKFQVHLLARYRDYLEAPSEFVLDKFQKNRFVAEHPEGGLDKSAGKDPSTGRALEGVGVQFLTEFMETQMFQCFVDDRYDQSSRGGAKMLASDSNLEILFFDESIDAALGKPASFLQDSTQNINPAARHTALEPNREGLAKGATFKYPGGRVPVPLDAALFGTPREVPDLAGDSTAVSGGASSGGGGVAGGSKRLDMDRISMKFFTEKRLYSQHFHTLRLRSAKQDGAFNHIATYFRASQSADEVTIASNDRLVVPTVETPTKETGTTIDPAWQSLKKYVAEELSLFTESFKTLREDVCIPLYTSCSESEHRLKILFSEANILEAHAAKGKSVVERTKSASISAFQKYEQLKTQLTQASVVLQPSEITRIVQSQNESEDSRLDLDEAETSFQTIVREYETRMPQIIASIRSLNQERIVQLKSSLEAWVQSKRLVLLGLMQQLDKVSQRVEEINAEKDLVSFAEGTTDFWTAARNTATAASASPPPEETVDAATAAAVTAAEADAAATASTDDASSPMVVSVTLDPSPSGASGAAPASTTPPSSSPSPPLATIGESGAAPAALMVVESPPASRLTVSASSPTQAKRPSTSVRSSTGGGEVLCYPLHLWGIDGFERAAAEAQTTRKVMKELIACMSAWYEVVDTKSKKIHGSLRALPELLTIPGIGSHQRAVWETQKSRALASSKALGDFGLSMLKLVSALSLTKGELKMSIQRFREHRIKLEKEVQIAGEVRAKSFEKKERTARALAAYQKQQAVNPTGSATAAATGAAVTAPLVTSGSFVAAAIAKQNAAAAAAAAESASSPSQSHLGGHGLVSQKQLELQSSLFERLNREAKEAQHEHELNERNAQAVQRKHDICVARLLRLFEKKERNGQTELKKTFGVLAESWAQKILATERSSDESLSQAVKKTQLVQDWQEFVEQTLKQQQAAATATAGASSSSSAAAPAAPTTVSAVVASGSTSAAAAITAVDFSKSLGVTGYVPVASLLQCSISWVRNTSTLLAEMSAADDAEVKLLRKFAFKIRACRPNTTVASAAAAFETLLDRMADVTEDAARVGLDTAAPFSKLKSSLKSHAKAFDAKYADQEKALNKAVEERKAAHAAELRAAEALRIAREKVSQAAAAPGDAPVKKGLFSSFMATPLKDLQNKEAAAAKEAEKAAATTQEKEMGLLVATSKRATELRELLHEMQTVEHRRWISQSDLLTALLVKHSLHLDKMQTLFHNYSERVVSIDVDADLAQFIHQNQQALKPPEYVYEDYSKYIDAVAQAATNKSPTAQQDEMITSPIPLPGSPFVFAKRITTGSHAHTSSMDKPGGSPQVAGGSRVRSVTSHAVTSGKPLPVLAAPSSRASVHLSSATTHTGSVARSATAEEPSASSALQLPATGKEESVSSARPVENSTSSAPAGAAAAASSAESGETAATDSVHPEMSLSEELALPVGRTRGMTVAPQCPPSTEPLDPNPNANSGGSLAPAATEDEDVQDPETGAWVKHHVNAALNESGVDEAAAGASSAAVVESASAESAESSLCAKQPPALQTQSSMSEMQPSPSPASSTSRPQLTAAEINSAFLSPNSVVSTSSTSHASQEAAAAQQQEQAAASAKLEDVAAHAQKQEEAAKVEAAEVPVASSVVPATEAVSAVSEPVASAETSVAEAAPASLATADAGAEAASSSGAVVAPLAAVPEDASSASDPAAESAASSVAGSSSSSAIVAPVAQLPPALPTSKPTPRTSMSHAKPAARPTGPAPTPPGLTSDSPKPAAEPTQNLAQEPSNSTPATVEATVEAASASQLDETAAAAAASSPPVPSTES